MASTAVAGTATVVPWGVGVVPKQASNGSMAIRTAGTVNFHTGRLPLLCSVMHRWVGAGRFSCFELPSFSVKLKLELQRPVLFGEGSL